MRTRDPPDRLASGTPDTKSLCHKHVQQAIGLSFWHFARGGIAAGTCRATRPRARRGARRRSASDPPGDRREPVGFPEFAGAGKLWLWIPQVRAGLDIASHGATRLGIEAAALAPPSGDPQTAFFTQPDIAERSSRPFLEGRLRARWGEGDSRGEASIGGHYGWLAVGPDWRVVTRAAAVSVWTSLAHRLELRGEAYAGQALAGLGGGGVGQSFGRQRRNLAVEGHASWRRAPVVVGAEVRRLKTRYGATRSDAGVSHVNLAIGSEF